MTTSHHSDADASTRILVVPARLRRGYWILVAAVCVYGGWLWLGNSGAGLLTLWCMARKPWHSAPFLLPPLVAGAGKVIVEPWRIAMVVDGRRFEVFRDEVTPREWSWLRAWLNLD